MRKELLISVVLFAFLMVPVAYAAECMTADELAHDSLEARYKFAEYRIEARLVSMQAVIDYLEDEENNTDTDTLVSIKGSFEDAADALKDATTVAEYTDAATDLKNYAKDFRDEARSIVHNLSEAKLAINASLVDNEGDLNKLLSAAYAFGKSQQLERFDESVCRLEEKADKLKDLSYDTSDTDSDIDDYKDLRGDVEDALDNVADSCANQTFADCDSNEKDDYSNLKADVKDNFLKVRTHMGLMVSKQLFDKTESIISKLKKAGMDVSGFEDQLSELRNTWSDLEDSFNDEKYNLGNDISDLRKDIAQLREDMRDAIKDFNKTQKSKSNDSTGGEET